LLLIRPETPLYPEAPKRSYRLFSGPDSGHFTGHFSDWMDGAKIAVFCDK